MEMHQVRYFLAMARTLNFTRAAEACNVSQPSLTRAIQKLEEEFDGPLFRRERSRTHLTDLGRLMQPHLERTLEAAQTAKALARGVGKAQVAPLRLGVADGAESEALNEVLAEIAGALPGFELTLTGGDSERLIEAGLSGDLDLLIVEAPEETPDRWESWTLFERAYHLLTHRGHPLAGRDAVAVEELRDEPWIDPGREGTRLLRTLAERAGFSPEIRHRADSPAHLRLLVAAGLGSALAPRPRDLEGIGALPLACDDARRPVVLAAIAGRRRSPAADAFVRASRARSWETVTD